MYLGSLYGLAHEASHHLNGCRRHLKRGRSLRLHDGHVLCATRSDDKLCGGSGGKDAGQFHIVSRNGLADERCVLEDAHLCLIIAVSYDGLLHAFSKDSVLCHVLKLDARHLHHLLYVVLRRSLHLSQCSLHRLHGVAFRQYLAKVAVESHGAECAERLLQAEDEACYAVASLYVKVGRQHVKLVYQEDASRFVLQVICGMACTLVHIRNRSLTRITVSEAVFLVLAIELLDGGNVVRRVCLPREVYHDVVHALALERQRGVLLTFSIYHMHIELGSVAAHHVVLGEHGRCDGHGRRRRLYGDVALKVLSRNDDVLAIFVTSIYLAQYHVLLRYLQHGLGVFALTAEKTRVRVAHTYGSHVHHGRRRGGVGALTQFQSLQAVVLNAATGMVHAVDDSARCLRLGLEAGRIDIKIYVVHTFVHSVYLVTHHHKVSLTELQRLGGKHGFGSATLQANLYLVSIVCGSEEHATQLCGGYAFCDDRLLGSRLKRQRIYIALRTRLHIDKG